MEDSATPWPSFPRRWQLLLDRRRDEARSGTTSTIAAVRGHPKHCREAPELRLVSSNHLIDARLPGSLEDLELRPHCPAGHHQPSPFDVAIDLPSPRRPHHCAPGELTNLPVPLPRLFKPCIAIASHVCGRRRGISPESTLRNWTWEVKPARQPNTLLGALIKKFWPGRYTPLSMCFYRVDPEHETQARLTLRGACERLTPQQWYNQKVTCASAFWANKGKRVKKEYYVGNQPTEEWAMTIEEYMSVCPEWAEKHREAWEELIRARWLRLDEEFAAVSRRNMENRGTGGTHCAGGRDYTRFKGKKVAEAPPGVVLHDAQIYDMMRQKQKPNPALPQPQYYGNAKAAKEDYCDMVLSRHPEVDDPLSIPIDEESLVLSGHGRPHGRFPFLNKVVKPTPATSYTRLKHTLTADSPQPRPRPARPPAYDPEFEAAFEACNEAYQQAAAQWNRQNTAYMAYIGVSLNLSSRK
ncbi:uncharacterized protein [Lolium perenne]|uniref:uncharacterized protein n=1 Tax=Lolium perenne TaxID=4522 RepID=UPI003A98E09D